MRRLRLGASAQTDYAAFDPETRAMFDAYAAGINAFIETTPVLPVEYQPRPRRRPSRGSRGSPPLSTKCGMS